MGVSKSYKQRVAATEAFGRMKGKSCPDCGCKCDARGNCPDCGWKPEPSKKTGSLPRKQRFIPD